MTLARWMVLTMGCAGTPPSPAASVTDPSAPPVSVEQVRATGEAGAYTVYVTLASQETGCDQYADWWEVVTPAGELLYRRILNHSHPDDQPFERSGGPVPMQPDDEVIVRAHMHPAGFVGRAVRGSLEGGFTAEDLAEGFAADLEVVPPQPESCLF